MSHHKSGKLRNYTDSRQFLTSAGDNGWIFHVSWVPVATAICHNVIKVAQVSTANTFNTKELIQKKSPFLWPSPFNMSFLWNDYILPFTSSLSQQCREYLLCLSSRWAIARASYCYVLILWRNLFQPPSIFDLHSPSIFSNLLKPCIRPWSRARLGLLGTIRFQARQNMFFHRELRGSPKRFHQWSPSYTTASQSARPLHLSFC